MKIGHVVGSDKVMMLSSSEREHNILNIRLVAIIDLFIINNIDCIFFYCLI